MGDLGAGGGDEGIGAGVGAGAGALTSSSIESTGAETIGSSGFTSSETFFANFVDARNAITIKY